MCGCVRGCVCTSVRVYRSMRMCAYALQKHTWRSRAIEGACVWGVIWKAAYLGLDDQLTLALALFHELLLPPQPLRLERLWQHHVRVSNARRACAREVAHVGDAFTARRAHTLTCVDQRCRAELCARGLLTCRREGERNQDRQQGRATQPPAEAEARNIKGRVRGPGRSTPCAQATPNSPFPRTGQGAVEDWRRPTHLCLAHVDST